MLVLSNESFSNEVCKESSEFGDSTNLFINYGFSSIIDVEIVNLISLSFLLKRQGKSDL